MDRSPVTASTINRAPALRDPRAIIERAGAAGLVGLLRVKLGFPPEVFECAVHPVIEAYAGFVALLPAPESSGHAEPGGRLTNGLAVALRALELRRGLMLPRATSLERVGAHAHRWTYAVFVAALLDTIETDGAAPDSACTTPRGEPGAHRPLVDAVLPCAGPRCGIPVHVGEGLQGLPGNSTQHLFEAWIPRFVRDWLGEDDALMAELHAWLNRAGDALAPGAIGELVLRAAGRFRATGIAGSTEQRRREPRLASGDADDGCGERGGPRGLGSGVRDSPLTRVAAARATLAGEPTPADQPSQAIGCTEIDRVPDFDLARTFMDWLRRGLSGGAIAMNRPAALVHGVNEGMLLVSPQIFRAFLKHLEKSGRLGCLAPCRDHAEVVKRIQRQVLRAGWHRQADRGVNMLTYEMVRGDRIVAISGVVIVDPSRFVDSAPTANPLLVRAPIGRDRQ